MSDIFLYESVAKSLEAAITEGVFKVGDRLPSIRQVCQKYEVNASTAVRAYEELEQRDLVEPRERSGYFVKHKTLINNILPVINKQDLTVYDIDVVHILKKLNQAKSNKNIVALSASVPDSHLIPQKKIARIIRQITAQELEKSLMYDSMAGLTELRQEIAKHYSSSIPNLNSDGITITNGCLEAINLCLRATVQQGDTIAVTLPCYFGILRALQAFGLKVVEIPRNIGGNDMKNLPNTEGFDVLQLEKLISEKNIKAILCLANFNNPDGLSISDENKKQMAAMAARLKIPIIEDDIYTDLHFSEHRPLSIKAYDKAGWVVLCSSFSKILAPGLRVGWVVGGRFHEKLENLKFTSNYSVPIFNQLIVKHLMHNNGLERHLKTMRRVLIKQYYLYRNCIEKNFPDGMPMSNPQGGFVLWLELPKTIEVLKLYNKALESGVAFSIGQLFSPSKAYSNCIRISFSKAWNLETENAIKKLGSLVKEMM
jgi:DNA-binding transcriptional MocR family regulator